jgi:hypothetical protein
MLEGCDEDLPNECRQVAMQEAPDTAVCYTCRSSATMSEISKMSKENLILQFFLNFNVCTVVQFIIQANICTTCVLEIFYI